MGTNGRHIGFLEKAPEEVYWSELSWVVPVPPSDRRDCRGVQKITIIYFFSLLGLIILLNFLGPPVFTLLGLPEKLSITVTGLLLLIWFLTGYFAVYTQKWVFLLRLRTRNEMLFEPDRESVFVSVEDPLTYTKQKLVTEDYGMMHITPGLIQLEMIGHRAQFVAEELAASFVHDHKTGVGVQLIFGDELYPWSVVVTPFGMSYNLFQEANGKKRAEWLLGRLVEAGVSSPHADMYEPDQS